MSRGKKVSCEECETKRQNSRQFREVRALARGEKRMEAQGFHTKRVNKVSTEHEYEGLM